MLVGLSVSLLPFYHERFKMATSMVAQEILTRCFLQSHALIQDEVEAHEGISKPRICGSNQRGRPLNGPWSGLTAPQTAYALKEC